jgi:hypothetical protein
VVDEPSGDTSERTYGSETGLAEARGRIEEERQALSDAMGGAREAVVTETKNLADAASARLGDQANEMKDEAAAGLAAFSEALKAASSDLSGKNIGFAGDMVAQAADGLENLARSLEGRSSGEMLEAIRSFGRQNPIGFIAGSVLAGFALGRVASVVQSPAKGKAQEGTEPIRQERPPSGGMPRDMSEGAMP